MKLEQAELLDLIRRSRQGDPEAQEALILAAQNKIYYHCKKILKHEEDAQDATQDVLIVMITSLDKLKEPAAPKAKEKAGGRGKENRHRAEKAKWEAEKKEQPGPGGTPEEGPSDRKEQ